MYQNKKMIFSANTDEKLWNLWVDLIAGKDEITACIRKEVKEYLKNELPRSRAAR